MTPAQDPCSEAFDFLTAEAAIVARLRERVPDLAMVLSDADLGSTKGAQIPTPGALVVWGGAVVVDDSVPQATALRQTWAVVLVCRHAGDKTGAKARQAAGPLITQTIRALQSWQPSPGLDVLRLTEAVDGDVDPGGALYVTLTFTTDFVLPAVPQY
jgi:hypothetical protein